MTHVESRAAKFAVPRRLQKPLESLPSFPNVCLAKRFAQGDLAHFRGCFAAKK
jgi:hypothetical protein